MGSASNLNASKHSVPIKVEKHWRNSTSTNQLYDPPLSASLALPTMPQTTVLSQTYHPIPPNGIMIIMASAATVHGSYIPVSTILHIALPLNAEPKNVGMTLKGHSMY